MTTAEKKKPEKIAVGSRVYFPPAWPDFPKCWVEAGIKPGPDGTVKRIEKSSAWVLFDGEDEAQVVLLDNLRLVSQRPKHGPNKPKEESA